jgi:hypothetical protein
MKEEIAQAELLQEKFDALSCEKYNSNGGYQASNLIRTPGTLHLCWWPGPCDHMDDQGDKLMHEVAAIA